MQHHDHHSHHQPQSLKKLAFSATLHCLTGCSIGEVSGMVLGSLFHWPNIETVIVSIILAFIFGYSLTLKPLLTSAIPLKRALALAFASDTFSIATMEVFDNLVMLIIPGAMDAHVTTVLFWGSMLLSLILGFLAAFPVNMFLISKGRGHALVHSHH
jgi:hypothetical protein